jgi:hypothetical protein
VLATKRALMGWTPPTASMCQSGGVETPLEGEASMGNVSIIGLDLAKNVFQAHGADASGAVVFRKKLRRAQVWNSLRLSRRAPWRWRPAEDRISGGGRSVSSDITCG